MDVLYQIKSLCMLLLLVAVNSDGEVAGNEKHDQVKELLSKLNKNPVKSIVSPGDIIDCVRLYDQPALDHPKLRNHTIQSRPSQHPFDNSTTGGNENGGLDQLWHLSGSCPEGTIPIKRIREEDILRVGSVGLFGKKHPNSFPRGDDLIASSPFHEYAIAYVSGKFNGARGTMNVWNPLVQQSDEFSLSQMWVMAGPYELTNTLEAGWQVYPKMYGDNQTRLFIFWTADGYQTTGCYNLLCSGFVQTNKNVAIGAARLWASIYDGVQYEMLLWIWKDPSTWDWWLGYGEEKISIGYWPRSLFTYLADDGAEQIHWGGEIINTQTDGMHTTTDMGSGEFPGGGFRRTSFFKNLQVLDTSNNLQDADGLRTSITRSTCYSITLGSQHSDWKTYFFYGGPGRNDGCP